MEENKYTVGEDDGSLAFLNIAPDPDNKFFNCDTVKQMALANRTAHYLRLGISGKRLRMKTASWTGWCKHADCKHLKKTILKSA